MVSWQAVALHFADRGSACAVLDRTGSIQLFSASLESLLGVQREDVEGHPWPDVVSTAAARESTRSRIERALSGTLRSFESEAEGSEGRRFRLSLEAALVGRDEGQGLLLTVSSAVPLEDESADKQVDDVEYEISGSLSEFGRLFALRRPGRAARTSFEPSARCFDMFHGRTTPCADCPALRGNGEAWPRTIARRIRGKTRGYEVVTAETVEDRVQVKLRRIPEETVGAIYDSKVRDLSDAANLSERERAVLTYLLMGRSLNDIGAILNISPRTVKFHQANVLEKLGADSRADLIRLIT